MIQDVLRAIGGVGTYGILSVLLFFLFFTGVLVWTFCLNKTHLEAMGTLPLEEESKPIQPGDHDHE